MRYHGPYVVTLLNWTLMLYVSGVMARVVVKNAHERERYVTMILDYLLIMYFDH